MYSTTSIPYPFCRKISKIKYFCGTIFCLVFMFFFVCGIYRGQALLVSVLHPPFIVTFFDTRLSWGFCVSMVVISRRIFTMLDITVSGFFISLQIGLLKPLSVVTRPSFAAAAAPGQPRPRRPPACPPRPRPFVPPPRRHCTVRWSRCRSNPRRNSCSRP